MGLTNAFDAGFVWDLNVFVPGKPIQKGSTTAFAIKANNKRGMRAVTTADNKGPAREWASFVRDEARQHWIGSPTAVPVYIEIEFVLPRRASAPKTRTVPHTRKPDLDKLIRNIWDSLTHVVWVDDAQVVSESSSKREAEIGEVPGAHIRVRVLG